MGGKRTFARIDSFLPVRQGLSMDEDWSQIRDRFRVLRKTAPSGLWADALFGVEQLAHHIAAGPHRDFIFGWTSIHDLCVQQTDVRPHSGPFLRVRPLTTGVIEFRYLDTAIQNRQWFREVPPAGVIGRFDTFLDQLGWVARKPV